jgi:lipoprotein-releasing system permease protein
MLNKFSYWLAIKCWFLSPKERPVFIMSLFGVIGIVIGVAALVIVMSVMNGFRIELEKNIRGLSSDINISSSFSNYIENSKEIIDELKNDDRIKSISKVIIGQGLLSSENASSGVIFRGMNVKTLQSKEKIITTLLGSVRDFEDNRFILIGTELARKIKVRIGDKVRLVLPSTNVSIFGSMPKVKEFEIIAIFNSGLYEYDAATILMNYDIASKLLSTHTSPTNLEIDIKTNIDVTDYTTIMQQKLFDYNLYATNWQMANEQFLRALKVERIAMFCVLSLIVFVAMFNILSGLFMTVKDKKRDIAILRSLGCSKGQILSSFILYGFFIGFIGIIVGILIGYFVASNIESIRNFLEVFSGTAIFEPAIYFLSYLPSKILISDLLLISSMTLLISLLGSIYPAYKASNMSPIEALRYE